MGSHAFARPDKEVNNKRPAWESPTTCQASEEEQRKQVDSYNRDSANRAEADRRAMNQKRTHQQDS